MTHEEQREQLARMEERYREFPDFIYLPPVEINNEEIYPNKQEEQYDD